MAGRSAQTLGHSVGEELQRPAPRLYLVTPPLPDAGDLAHILEQVLDTIDIAAVLLRLPETPDDVLIDHVGRIAPVVQARDIALILDGHPHLVARTGADGAHLTGIDAFAAAVPGLKPDRIAGAGGLRTRHDAMVAAERGADYVMFGEPDAARPPPESIVERLAWWAEVFEVPCVGYAENLDEVAALAAAGADFVALGEFVFFDSRGPSAMLRDAAERLTARGLPPSKPSVRNR
jgi:thiamine-phosphate pyrophosphorylase